ncbi:ATP-binding cassette domain-containing protein [Spongiactinospora sp. TRM90649]|uniref:ABC transporter ATP-binding protein n=1 Tax=Spongiactinospora sp. TRM90649 TaxID=3031114 RepID=UPI0023F85DB3|nr:ATP-binding cassette domain-containing protein [Spongiactinospora sp. TRM90649]MDF5752731.1 ATP-binding cassette domain-containing protein [Spongiactinospora sp. TRM90649]
MRLSSVSFRYARRGPWILRDVSLDLPPGQVLEVVGRNGAGKSTFLRLLAGALRPTRGAVAGRPRLVGYSPETFPGDQPFTVAGYLAAMARIRGVSGAGDWPERLGLTPLLSRPLGELSKGSAHKVGLAQALLGAAENRLLILDEPFAGLDTRTRAELPLIAGEIAADGGIVVVSDHQGELREVAARRILSVADTTVTPVESGDEEPLSVVEVVTLSATAAELAARLRKEGHEVRVRPSRPEAGAALPAAGRGEGA